MNEASELGRDRVTEKGSISAWIESAKQGDETSIRQLWDRYEKRIVNLARARLEGSPRRASDEEDVALSAFARFCIGLQDERFPQLESRNDLWRILAKITVQKALDQAKKEKARKRGGGTVRGDSAFLSPPSATDMQGIEQILCNAPTPELAASFAEECGKLLELLDDERLQAIALGKLEGHTNAELADRLGCGRATIARGLQLIRRKWEEHVA